MKWPLNAFISRYTYISTSDKLVGNVFCGYKENDYAKETICDVIDNI